MAVVTPDWLKSREGELRGSRDGHTWTIYFAGLPQYLIEPLPAGGQFSCRVTQTNNSKRVEDTRLYASRDEALKGGLEDLRNYLGW